nr:IclR family transcriptional regulator C-terminal domain-containing protein [Saccharopolyspora sp. HNM0983]
MITSVQRALRLLDAVAELPDGATAKYLARSTGLKLPTAYHLLRTLVYEGYLHKVDDGTFVLGERVSELNTAGRGHVTRGRVRAVMSALCDSLGAAIYLGRYHNGEVEVAEIVDNRRCPRVDTWVDFREAAHATAIGKCLLAGLSRDARADHFHRHPPADLTPRTVTRVHDLVEARRAELVLDWEEYSLGTACLAAPVAGAEPVTLAISFPANRSATTTEYLDPLRAAADELSRALVLDGNAASF